ncbi:MAG TPA: CBS domain-containing protein [Polyangiaceae bacterium]|nr:CBS domain-containing protein [Polyangiaceae bacterium]
MRCDELMKRDVRSVRPQDTAQLAAQRMRDENLGFLPVCDDSGQVLGTITDRDLAIRVLAGGMPADTHVEDVFTHEVIACDPADDLHDAQAMMARFHKSRIMCLDAGQRLVGVISLSDIAQQASEARAARTLRQISQREVRA